MQSLNTTSLPHVTIQKIYVNQHNVVVNAFLTVDNSKGSPFWMEEKYFTDFVDVHFILIHDGAEFAAKLTDPKSRVANMIAEAVSGEPILITDWMYDLRNQYDTTTVTLKEAINRDSENTVNNSGINNSETRTAQNLKDIAFSVEIPITKFAFGDSLKPQIGDLRLYCFSHLNAHSLVSEYNLLSRSPSITRLLEIGGNFKQDLLLETVDGILKVPETMDILTFMDGTPYSGAYHYHGPNPAPDGYIGWMEGPAEPHMLTNARRLKIQTVRYSKTVANFLIDDRFFVSNYNGSTALLDALENNYNSPWTPTANDFDSIFELNGGHPSDDMIRIYDPEFQAESSRAAFERQAANSSFQIIHNAEHYISSNQNRATNILEFDVNFENLIKSKSKYPFFIDRLNEAFGITKEQLLAKARITDMTIKRYRLSNSPRSNNPVGTAAYEVFNTDDIETTIARTHEAEESNTILTYYNENNEKILNEAAGSTPEIRKFKIHDHDMARNINFGKYAYKLELTVEDSIKKLIQVRVESLRGLISEYQKFISDASIPYMPINERYIGYEIPNDPGPDSLTVEGNLYFLASRYTEQFTQSSQADHGEVILSLIRSFVILHGFLGTIEPSQVLSVTEELVDAVLPIRGGDINSALKFGDKCRELLASYDNILLSDNHVQVSGGDTSIAAQQLVKLGRRNVNTKTSNSIEFKRVIPGHANAFSPGAPMLSYGLNEDFMNMSLSPVPPPRARTYDLSLTVGPQASDGLWVPPESFAIAQPEAQIQVLYNIDQWRALEPDQSVTATGQLQTIVDTPVETSQFQATSIEQGLPLELTDYGINGLSLEPPDSPTYRTTAADVNTSNTSFKSSDERSGLTQENQKAIVASSDSYDATTKYKKEQEAKKKEQARQNKKSLMKKLQQKISESKNKNQKSGDFFEQKKAKLMMMIEGSAQAEYVEVTKDNLNSYSKDNVKVKLADAEDKTNSKSSYVVTNNKAEVAKADLLAALDREVTSQATTAVVRAFPSTSSGTTYNL